MCRAVLCTALGRPLFTWHNGSIQPVRYTQEGRGRVRERPNRAGSYPVRVARLTRVRIPPLPPEYDQSRKDTCLDIAITRDYYGLEVAKLMGKSSNLWESGTRPRRLQPPRLMPGPFSLLLPGCFLLAHHKLPQQVNPACLAYPPPLSELQGYRVAIPVAKIQNVRPDVVVPQFLACC